MATARINGCTLHYEVLGAGKPIIFTPGGRLGREAVRPFAERFAGAGYRAIIYDRRNCGASEIDIAGDRPEHDLWADDLHELLVQLDARPAIVGGGSSGCRTSLILASRYSSSVQTLLLWWVTGGRAAGERLAYQYYGQFIEAAEHGGMEAVAATPFFAERIAANPSNRERLLAMKPSEFVRTMEGWRRPFLTGAPVIGATVNELATIRVPTMIVSGDDEIHPRTAAETLHRLLPASLLHPPLWTEEQVAAMMQVPNSTWREEQAERLTPIFFEFLSKVLTV